MTAAHHQLGPDLSVVLPACNEADNVPVVVARLRPILASTQRSWEIIFVDDGSRDATADQVQSVAAAEPRVRLLQLSRNFGHQAALMAGLEHAGGAAVITMDADLQHPPELIPDLLRQWDAGYEVVQTIRTESADAPVLKRTGSRWFYRVLGALTPVGLTPGAADFRLMARPAVQALLACRERRRCNRALVHWIGFRYTEVPYAAASRHAGRTKYSYRAMIRLAADAILSFSTWPLRLAGMIGGVVSLCAAAYLVFVLWAYFFTERTEPGWSSILATILILGGVNLMVLWILGEYVGRMYEEVKQRPLYIVRPPLRATAELPGTAGAISDDADLSSPRQTATDSLHTPEH
jgi:glycosyltransferase involved in cell wall biosynthesis